MTEPFLVVQPMFDMKSFILILDQLRASIVLEPTITCLISQPFSESCQTYHIVW
jgi:hypothetical protein